MTSQISTATSATTVTTWERWGAALYDPVLGHGERRVLGGLRRQLLAGARGRVVEIGAGTGLNLAHYPASVTDLVLTEPGPAMARRLRERVAGRPGCTVLDASAESLPFESGSVDTVVSTLVLCTVPDPERALREVARVLAPTGRLLFLEHVLAPEGARRRWQRRLAPLWARCAMGCRCDRDLLGRIAAELDVETVDRRRWAAMPPIVAPLVVGRATTRNHQEEP